MAHFWFWVFWALVLLAVLALPSASYPRERWIGRRGPRWRYGPSGGAALLALLVLFLFWLGLIAFWLPWYPGVA